MDLKDEQPQAEGQSQGQRHVKQADAADVLQKTGLENLLQCHDLLSLSIDAAGGVFGERPRPPVGEPHRVPDDAGKERVPLHLQDGNGLPRRDGHARLVQKVHAAQPGADVVVQRHPHVPRGIDEGLPGVVHDGAGPQALAPHLVVQLLDQGAAAVRHPGQIPVHDGLDLSGGQLRHRFGAQPVPLALLLQADEGGLAVVISDPEFFPAVHPVDLLPEGLVPPVVEVQAPDLVRPAHGVAVGPAHRPKPRPEGQPVGQIDLVLPLVPVSCRRHHILSMEGL